MGEYVGAVARAAMVSHIWFKPNNPDPDGEQADALRAYLRLHPEFEFVWHDAWHATKNSMQMLKTICGQRSNVECFKESPRGSLGPHGAVRSKFHRIRSYTIKNQSSRNCSASLGRMLLLLFRFQILGFVAN